MPQHIGPPTPEQTQAAAEIMRSVLLAQHRHRAATLCEPGAIELADADFDLVARCTPYYPVESNDPADVYHYDPQGADAHPRHGTMAGTLVRANPELAAGTFTIDGREHQVGEQT